MILITTAVLVGILVYAWDHVIDFCQRNLIPWIKENLPEYISNKTINLIGWLDDTVCWTKAQIKEAVKLFKKHILGSQTTYHKVSVNQVSAKTETVIQDSDGKLRMQTVEEDIAWEDLPPEIRKKMRTQNEDSARLDNIEVIEQKAIKKCEKESIDISDMELTYQN